MSASMASSIVRSLANSIKLSTSSPFVSHDIITLAKFQTGLRAPLAQCLMNSSSLQWRGYAAPAKKQAFERTKPHITVGTGVVTEVLSDATDEMLKARWRRL